MASAPDPDDARMVAALGNALGRATKPSVADLDLVAVLRSLRETFGAAACSYAEVRPGSDELEFVAADGAGAAAIVGVRMPVGRGIVGWVAVSGEPLQVGDLSQDARFARDVAEATDYVPGRILAAPAVDAHGETEGVVEVLDPTVMGAHTGHDLAVVGLVAAQIATVRRLSRRYDALGDDLLRMLVEMAGEDPSVVGSTETTEELTDLAASFRRLIGAGPAAAALAGRLLDEVADHWPDRGGRGR